MIGIISCESRSPNRINIGCSDTIVLPKGEIFKGINIFYYLEYIITQDTLGNHKIYLVSDGYLEERRYIINN